MTGGATISIADDVVALIDRDELIELGAGNLQYRQFGAA
jgi:hypothetical protein